MAYRMRTIMAAVHTAFAFPMVQKLGAFQSGECMAFRAGLGIAIVFFRRVLRRSIQDHVQRLLCHRQRKRSRTDNLRHCGRQAQNMLRLPFGECLRYLRAMCCGRKEKTCGRRKRPHVFVKERRFGESIYMKKQESLLPVCGSSAHQLPVTIGYFFEAFVGEQTVNEP